MRTVQKGLLLFLILLFVTTLALPQQNAVIDVVFKNTTWFPKPFYLLAYTGRDSKHQIATFTLIQGENHKYSYKAITQLFSYWKTNMGDPVS